MPPGCWKQRTAISPPPFSIACSSSSSLSPSFARVLSLSFGSLSLWAASSGWVRVLAHCETVTSFFLKLAWKSYRLCCWAFCRTPHLELPWATQANSQTLGCQFWQPRMAPAWAFRCQMTDKCGRIDPMASRNEEVTPSTPVRDCTKKNDITAHFQGHLGIIYQSLDYSLKHPSLLLTGNGSRNLGPVGVTCVCALPELPASPHPETSPAGYISQNRMATYFQKLASI